METIPKELASLIQSASKTVAPAAQAPAAPTGTKTSTDLLQGLLTAKEGKPDETLKSKLKDTDTLIRFAAGLGALLSGEAGMGAALVGAGFANAGQEAADDNKRRDEEAAGLKLKMAENAFQREGQMISAGVANPELIANMPDYMFMVGDATLGASLFNSAVMMRDRKAGKERAAFLMDSLAEMDDPDQRKLTVLEAGSAAGIYVSPEMADDIANKGLTAQTMLSLGATATPVSALRAWEWWVANPKDKDRDRKYIDMLVGLNPVRAGRTEGDFKFEIMMKRNGILAKVFQAMEDNPGTWKSPYDALYDEDVLTKEDRSFFLTSDNSFDLETLKNTEQQMFDLAEYNKAKEFAFEQATKLNVMARAEGREADIIKDVDAFSSGYALSGLTAAQQALHGVKIDRTDAVLGFTMGTLADYLGYPPGYQDTTGALQAKAGVEFREAVAAIKAEKPDIKGADLINAVYDYIADKYRTTGVLAPEGAEGVKRDPKVKVQAPKTGIVGGLDRAADAIGDAMGDVVEVPGRIKDIVTK
jgi:hypothetical protein